MVCNAVFLLLLTISAQSAACGSGPDDTATYTCGIKWIITLRSSITLTRAEGTMISLGANSNGFLATALTGAATTTLSIKADSTSVDFPDTGNLRISGATGYTYAAATSVPVQAPATCNGQPTPSREACENYVVVPYSAAVNTGISLGCSIWDLDCHGFVKPLEVTGINGVAVDEGRGGADNLDDRMRWEDIENMLNIQQSGGRYFRVGVWRMKWTIQFTPRAFNFVNFFRSDSHPTHLPSPIDGYVTQGQHKAISIVGAIRLFVIYTLDGSLEFSGANTISRGAIVTQGCGANGVAPCLLEGTVVSTSTAAGVIPQNQERATARYTEIVVAFETESTAALSARHAPTSTDDLVIFSNWNNDAKQKRDANTPIKFCGSLKPNYDCSNAQTSCAEHTQGTCASTNSDPDAMVCSDHSAEDQVNFFKKKRFVLLYCFFFFLILISLTQTLVNFCFLFLFLLLFFSLPTHQTNCGHQWITGSELCRMGNQYTKIRGNSATLTSTTNLILSKSFGTPEACIESCVLDTTCKYVTVVGGGATCKTYRAGTCTTTAGGADRTAATDCGAANNAPCHQQANCEASATAPATWSPHVLIWQSEGVIALGDTYIVNDEISGIERPFLSTQTRCTYTGTATSSTCAHTPTNVCEEFGTIPAAAITAVTSKTMKCGVRLGSDQYSQFSQECKWNSEIVARADSSEQKQYVTVEDGLLDSITFESEANHFTQTGGDIQFFRTSNGPNALAALTIKGSDITSVASSPVDDYVFDDFVSTQTSDQKMHIVCGTKFFIKGALNLQDLGNNVEGLYVNKCANSAVTSVDLKTFQSGAENTMKELILDETLLTSPPDLSTYTNLERLSISGITKNGALTSLPDISGLVHLKYLDISRHPGITSIPAGYFQTNVNLVEIVMSQNGITAFPDGLFDTCVNLIKLDFQKNKIQSFPLSISSDGTKNRLILRQLQTLNLRNNKIVVDETTPLSPQYFEELPSLENLHLEFNKIKFVSKIAFKNQLRMKILGAGGPGNDFTGLSACPTNYYATPVFIASASQNYYSCDLCVLDDNPNEKAYSCWTEVADVKTHYSPTICPRGHYCDSTTKTKSPCPAGKYNINIGEGTIAQCNNCEDGFYNPIEGQAICPFQCGPGTYGDHQGAVAANVDSCKKCKNGHYCSGYGVVEPVACPAGKYAKAATNSNIFGLKSLKECLDCPSGQYSNKAELISIDDCTQCPTGSTSEKGSTSLQNCVAGKIACPIEAGYRPTASGPDLQCVKCAVGRYGDDGTYCKLCPSGFYGPNEGASECEICATKSSCNFVGSSVRIDSTSAIEVPAWVTAASGDFSSDSTVATDEDGAGQASNNVNGLPSVTEVPIFRVEDGDKGDRWSVPDLVSLFGFLPVGIICFSILLLHRFFPKSCCPYDHFAQSNEIKDTHAVRKVTSRVGGAFTYILIITSAFLIFRSLTDRSFRTSTSDAPARVTEFGTLVNKTVNSKQLSFGKITIDVEGYVPIDPVTLAQRCTSLQLADRSLVSNKTAGLGSLMACTMAQKNNDPTTCGVTITCDASFDVRGAVSVALSIPGEFQTLTWQVKSTTWEFFEQRDFSVGKKWTRYETTYNNTLTSGSSASILKGTMEKPTSVKFGLTRGYILRLNIFELFIF